MSPEHTERPLVSIFMFVRNGGKSLRRAIDSVMGQTYPNIEFVVQDAVSTDATLDVLRSYGNRVKVVSEPDSGPSEGLWRAMNRCTGEFVGWCLADEELSGEALLSTLRGDFNYDIMSFSSLTGEIERLSGSAPLSDNVVAMPRERTPQILATVHLDR
jgi:glycosyltransferase involved in cell wall biosynthesis